MAKAIVPARTAGRYHRQLPLWPPALILTAFAWLMVASAIVIALVAR